MLSHAHRVVTRHEAPPLTLSHPRNPPASALLLQYWKVKNSWSEKWGLDGYILLVRGIAQDGGECGILRAPSYPAL